MKTLRIDFVSDVVCPWCAIGLLSLEQALDRLQGEIRAELYIQPFELDPNAPPEGVEIAGLLRRRGVDAAQLAELQERIRQRGAELGFVFDMDARQRNWNTFDAHRLLHWAGGEGRQRELKHALFRANFTEGRDVSDRQVLADAAAEAGLDRARALEVLQSKAHSAEVRAAEEFFRRNGIASVPAIIIDRRHLVSGGQPVEVFERALREIAAAKAE